jgi:hypothetical protein
MRERYSTQINNLLGDLFIHGVTPYRIAETLRTHEVTGWRGNATCDPIATYLERHVRDVRFAVHLDAIIVQDRHYDTVSFRTPDAIADFIRMFDRGHYPFLETEERAIRERHFRGWDPKDTIVSPPERSQ